MYVSVSVNLMSKKNRPSQINNKLCPSKESCKKEMIQKCVSSCVKYTVSLKTCMKDFSRCLPVQAKLDSVFCQQWAAVVDVLYFISQIITIKHLWGENHQVQRVKAIVTEQTCFIIHLKFFTVSLFAEPASWLFSEMFPGCCSSSASWRLHVTCLSCRSLLWVFSTVSCLTLHYSIKAKEYISLIKQKINRNVGFLRPDL